MKKHLKTALKVTISLLMGIFIFWWAYRNMDTEKIFEILRNNVRYEYIWIGVFIGILADLLRALRWKMQIDALGEQKPTTLNTFFAVMIGYFVNFLIPRGGEVVRCGIINQYHKIAFTKVLGTMIAERAFDIIIMFLLTAAGILLQITLFNKIFPDGMSFSFSEMYYWIGSTLLLLCVLFFIFRSELKNTFAYKKIAAMFKDIGLGIKTSLQLKNRNLFFLYTIGIWGCYFLMTYIPIFAFGFENNLSVAAVFFVFVMGNLGTAAPVPGGIGAWHYMTIASLMLFGIGEVEAGAFAVIVHGSQMFAYMIGGILSFIGLPIANSKERK